VFPIIPVAAGMCPAGYSCIVLNPGGASLYWTIRVTITTPVPTKLISVKLTGIQTSFSTQASLASYGTCTTKTAGSTIDNGIPLISPVFSYNTVAAGCNLFIKITLGIAFTTTLLSSQVNGDTTPVTVTLTLSN
jgi:hypothetical protein